MVERFAAAAWDVIQPASPDLIFIGVLFIIAVIGVKVIDNVTDRLKKRIHDSLRVRLISALIQTCFLLVIILIMLTRIGVDQQFLRLIGLVVGGIVAFSSSALITNFVAGWIIHINRPFRKGDIICIDDVLGKVVDITSVYTRIHTFQKTYTYMPNSQFITGRVKNYSQDGYRVQTEVSLGYNVDRITAENALVRAAKLAKLDDAFVAIIELGNYTITYQLNATCRDPMSIPFIESRLRKLMIDELTLDKVEIASPHIIAHRKGRAVKPTVKKQALRKREKQEGQLISKLVKDTFESEPPKK